MLCNCKQLRSSEWVGNASFYVWPVTVAKADIQKRKLQGVLSYRRMIRISVTQKVSDVKVTPTRQETRTKLGRVRRRNNIPIRTYVMVHTGVNEYRQRWTSLSLGSKQGDIRWADCSLKVGQLTGTFKSGFSRLMKRNGSTYVFCLKKKTQIKIINFGNVHSKPSSLCPIYLKNYPNDSKTFSTVLSNSICVQQIWNFLKFGLTIRKLLYDTHTRISR